MNFKINIKNKSEYSGKRGSMLIYAMLILISVIAISMSLIRIILPKLVIARESVHSSVAIYTADSAVEWCLNNLKYTSGPPPYLPNIDLYFPFDEGTGTVADDASGNSNVTNLIGGATWGAGRWGSALSFDSSGEYAEVVNNLNFDFATSSGSFTIELRINPNTVNGFNPILDMETDTGFIPRGFGLYLEDGRIVVRIGGTVPAITSSGPNIQANVWTHVAFTVFTGTGQVRLFVNGVNRGTANGGWGPYTFENCPILIGRSWDWAWWDGCDNPSLLGTDFFNGRIDELRIYDSILSDQQIASTANPVIPPIVMSNGASYSLSYPASGTATSTCSEGLINHRVVGTFRGVARSLEIFE